MSSIIWDPSVGDTATSEMAYIFRSQPNIQKFIHALFVPMQDIENALQQLYEDFLMNAYGIQLDNFGTIVGQPRNAQTDAQYIISILAKIGENNSRSRRSDLIYVFGIVTGSTSIHVVEAYPASVAIIGNQNINGATAGQVLAIMQRVVGAGINVYGVSFTGGPGSFSFFGNPTGRGFSDVGQPPGTGGRFIDIA